MDKYFQYEYFHLFNQSKKCKKNCTSSSKQIDLLNSSHSSPILISQYNPYLRTRLPYQNNRPINKRIFLIHCITVRPSILDSSKEVRSRPCTSLRSRRAGASSKLYKYPINTATITVQE